MWQNLEHARMVGGRVRQALGGGLVGTMIGALITVLIFVVLAPVVADETAAANIANFSGGAGALFLLTPLFFVILGIVGIVKLIR